MGMQPLAEHDNGERYPLRLIKCTQCTLVQLSYIPDQHDMFPPDHPFATGNTRANHVNAASLAKDIAEILEDNAGGMVVDIGANDGTLLSEVKKAASTSHLVAVEPTNQAAKCRDKGFLTWQQFFTSVVAKEVARVCGQAQVITACNVLAHVPDPHDFLEGVKILLADDGVFITENHDWASIANGLQIDTVYHEHLRFYSVASLSRLLADHGFLVDDMKKIPMHGGSFRTFAVREKENLESRAYEAALALHKIICDVTSPFPDTVYGIGATTRATPLLHYAHIWRHLTCVCEVSSSEKIGTNIPGTDVPVVDEKKLFEDQPPYALILSWHIADDIIPKLREKGYKGKFIIPLPQARIRG